ncbi:uncharacterized protein EI97DRAFT_171603 [Westerdykella ornata]|uniref:Fermentation associated protein n=1 Tax=Westerdykella ornata TaxID=318751 RepID=A0A6A6JSB7_WESOR|nr:uncharacterized protein EI97DRAFT_171603 [Westerdykella ornata]KAF2279287.1 hypothetical protein EI97DRAFT_171603 [Westerdykella ornata]
MLVCCILAVFFLFYFNRLFATLVSYGIRAYTWHKFHAYIDIQALQISLLGGRLFFKDIRYHGHNQTILVHGGHVTWQYWLRRVRDAEVYSTEAPPGRGTGPKTPDTRSTSSDISGRTDDQAERGGSQSQKRLSCRVTVKISGLEAFMYNRSPAYDVIVEALQRKANAAQSQGSKAPMPGQQCPSNSLSERFDDLNGNKVQPTLTEPSAGQSTSQDALPCFLRLLPISVECNKGAVVVGNEHTDAVITAHFDKASGEFDAGKSGPLDMYRQIFNFSFTHPVVRMVPNPDHKSSQLDFAAQIKHESAEAPIGQGQEDSEKQNKRKRKPWRTSIALSSLFSKSSDSVRTDIDSKTRKRKKYHEAQFKLPGEENWRGLTRYLADQGNGGHTEWLEVQYASASVLLDSPRIDLSFHWDVPGLVPGEMENSSHVDPAYPDDINGSIPPAYGMDIQLHGGTINYGPWADRHRAALQAMYFPGLHVDAEPASALVAGNARVLTIFKIHITIEDDTVVRIPIREFSKDWKWKGKAKPTPARDKQPANKLTGKPKSRKRTKHRDNAPGGGRPFGWIDVKVAGNTSLNYIMDMVPSKTGYHNKLDIDVISTEVSSSVNHGLLWRSGHVSLDCDLSNPLGWNSLRKWVFSISCQDLELFLLRDHLFLLTDLVTDWGSGAGPDYFTFVPFQYLLKVNFDNFKLYLNTNDSNIINNPADLDDNNFIILYGRNLHGDVVIPLDRFRPLQNEITFDLRGRALGLELCMPPRNTLKSFIKSTNVASVGDLVLKGSHTYMTDTSPESTDRLFMDIQGSGLILDLYGWLVHHFLKLKDNYFGEDLHFKTLDEFQGLSNHPVATEMTAQSGHPSKSSNDLDVILCISAEQGMVSLPSNLYSSDNCIRVDIPYASADLRFTNYYMDLMVNFSPVSLSVATSIADPEQGTKIATGQTEMFIDSLEIYGHRLFGLPPAEPTYVCNWDFDVGTVSGECTPKFIETAVGAARSFAFTFDDPENSLATADPIVIHDSTFLRLKTREFRLWFHIATEAMLLTAGPLTIDFNDWAGTRFSQRVNVSIPDLSLAMVDAKSAFRHRTQASEKQAVQTHAFLQTNLTIDMLRRKLDFSKDRSRQQTHMRRQDQRTHRTPFLFIDQSADDHNRNGEKDIRAPAMQFPDLPHPVFLYRPSERGSTVSSDYHFEPVSTTVPQLGRVPLRSTSTSSLARSIKSSYRGRKDHQVKLSGRHTALDGRHSRAGDPLMAKRFTPDEGIKKENSPPTSLAWSSPLATPHFPLAHIETDLTEVPHIPEVRADLSIADDETAYFNDISTSHLDEDFDHITLIITAEPGVRGFCSPDAVRCMSNLLSVILPKAPEDLLDEFHVCVMDKVLESAKLREGKGKSVDICVRVPFAHFRFLNEYAEESSQASGKDQYDIILNRLNLAARVKKSTAHQALENTVALHTVLDSLGFSITERKRPDAHEDVAIQAELKDILFWALRKKEASMHISFRTLRAATASKQISYLTDLILRTAILGDELVTCFNQVKDAHQLRLQYLAWFLSDVQSRFGEPTFMTKASFALRTDRDHLRNHDSWKIISRLRHIWRSLSIAEQHKLTEDCAQRSIACPTGVKEMTIARWDQWRTWELGHAKSSLAMKVLFDLPSEQGPVRPSVPVRLDVRAHSLSMVIDPGPTQSEASLRILTLNIAAIPPSQPTGLMLLPSQITKKSTTVQLGTEETSIRLRWELCELIEILITKFQHNALGQRGPPQHTSIPASTPSEEHEVQFVYVSDRAEVCLDTINLRASAEGEGLRFSVANSIRPPHKADEVFTALIHLEQAVMQLGARTRPLVVSQYDRPSLYVALSEFGHGKPIPGNIKLAGTSRTIKMRVKEDILGTIEVIDLVLRDEVAYLHKQTTALKSSVEQEPGESVVTAAGRLEEQLPEITLALFMDAYTVELALLQSLAWKITGSSGRISVVPALGQEKMLKVDYDLAAHRHEMVSTSPESPSVISSLELPPFNGRLIAKLTPTETRISASGIVETIHLQGSEIQAIVATLNKPEFSNFLTAIKEDIGILQTHVAEVFPKNAPLAVAEDSQSSPDLLFDVGMTLSGLVIVANAPGRLPSSATASLSIELASILLKATNISPDQSRLDLPESVAHLGELTVALTLSDAETIRRCGDLAFGASLHATTQEESSGRQRVIRVRSSGMEVNMFADTASAVVDVVNHLQDKIKDLDLSKERKILRRLRHSTGRISHRQDTTEPPLDQESVSSGGFFTSTYDIELSKIQVSWIVGTSIPPYAHTEVEDLVLSFRTIRFHTRKAEVARLMIEDMRLQMVPISAPKDTRSLNSALLPEVVFYVRYSSTNDGRNVAFQAAGKSLDLCLNSRFILPANIIERSIALAGRKFHAASATWSMTPTTTGAQRKNPFGNKRFASILVGANFAGAVVHITARDPEQSAGQRPTKAQQKGRYSQFIGDESKSSMVLKAPGIALKVEYKDDGHDPSMNGELRIDGSSNTLYPTVVPLLIDIADSIKGVVRDKPDQPSATDNGFDNAPKPLAKLPSEENLITADPSAILGRTRLNLGLRICKQEFSLSCQPIARVVANAKLDDIYITVNNVKSEEHGHFFAASAVFEKLVTKVQHVYSRESTFGFEVDAVVLSLMNSKHLSGTGGISAILKFDPTRVRINARQLQDFLLFREIWLPPEMRQASKPPTEDVRANHPEYLIQRYEQATAATAFPWNANVTLSDVRIDLDLGQAIGKSSLHIHSLWASSRKSTNWEQNMCIGAEKIALESTGRTSGFAELHGVRVRTFISWPSSAGVRLAPLVQASLGFNQFRVKSSFDYQTFATADIANFNFLMYNVRDPKKTGSDRLVNILDGDKIFVCCTATSAAQGLALYQAIQRLVQENQQAYAQSLKEIEKYLRRSSSIPGPLDRSPSQGMIARKKEENEFKAPIFLHTDAVVTLRSINFGVFPSNFVDNQMLSIEAGDVQARFAAAFEEGKIRSGLGLTLGKLSVALAGIPTPKQTTPASDLTIEDVLDRARSARGGIIVRVPKVVANMHTWQAPDSNAIDYIFQSNLEGKVDVGWNYSRISYIKGMWSNHSRTLASRLGKPLPESNIKITSSQETPSTPSSTASFLKSPFGSKDKSAEKGTDKDKETVTPSDPSKPQGKITAEIKVPQSRYTYHALEPPIIETPQLRDMGEATPPLEWIGLHRDRLPNVTHQVVIVALLEMAREVEEAYKRILGSS